MTLDSSNPITRPSSGTRRRLVMAALMAGLTACGDGATAPTPLTSSPSLHWNARARTLVSALREAPPRASRVYALLSVAQHHAYQDAVPAGELAAQLAVESVSAATLAALFPAQAGELWAERDARRAALVETGASIEMVAAGEQAATVTLQRVLSRAALDGADAVWSGTVPSGPGLWQGVPQLPHWGSVVPWLMSRGDQFRVPAPPAPGSAAFEAALAELRAIAATRDSTTLAIALYWADGAATPTPAGHWNAIAADMLVRLGAPERSVTRVMALLNVAMMDAMIACWDSKYTYWLLRPWEADTAVTTPIGRPPHPSYPSGHACATAAAVEVLGAQMPAQRRALEAMRAEAADARVFAGVHYRFDVEAGETIGRAVGALAVRPGLPIPDGTIVQAPR